MSAEYRRITGGVLRLSDGACIAEFTEDPNDPEHVASPEWCAYLEWVGLGGVAEDMPPMPVVPFPPQDNTEAEQAARHEAKVALLAALPEGSVTQGQMDVLFGANGDPIP